MFSPFAGGWGKKGATRVHLKAATERVVAKALADAWEKNAPKPKAKKTAQARTK
jgi:hypothetical protein